MNKLGIDFKEIEAKSILTASKIPGVDYVVNPYTGCRFGCIYCYASFMGRFAGGKTIDEWGSYVYAKTNAPQLLTKEITKIPNQGKGKELLLSSVTDPYQGVEAKYQLTRKCLQVLANYKFEGLVSILTKSDLVTRDIDLLKQLKHVSVGLTITSTNDDISRYFEKMAPGVTERLKALDKLNQAGISTYAFIGPLLPHFIANQKSLEKIFSTLKNIGTTDVFVEHLNLSPYIKERLIKEMGENQPEIMAKFYQSQSKNYREELDVVAHQLLKKYGMNLLRGATIFHSESKKYHNK
jgi:DNA repair photolyase